MNTSFVGGEKDKQIFKKVRVQKSHKAIVLLSPENARYIQLLIFSVET